MFDMFGDQVSTPMPALELDPTPVPRGEELMWEKELLGVYVSEHPFTAAAGTLSTYVSALASELSDAPQQGATEDDDGTPIAGTPLPPQGRDVVIAGMVGNTRRLYTRDSRAFCAAEIEDMSGTVEVTVWPELFERTQELWMEGNILLLQVRQRERNGRVQISVQQVEVYQLADGTPAGFVPPPWAAVVARPVPTDSSASDANGAGVDGANETAPERTDTHSNGAVTANGKTNGASTAVRLATKPAPRAPAPAPRTPVRTAATVATAARTLRVELYETEDEDADRDRLTQLLEVLREYPGEDEVRFSVRTLDGGVQNVGLGKLRVGTCDELSDKLEDILGEAGEVGTS
jgi:DNA polymerase-3 subunit alpha